MSQSLKFFSFNKKVNLKKNPNFVPLQMTSVNADIQDFVDWKTSNIISFNVVLTNKQKQ